MRIIFIFLLFFIIYFSSVFAQVEITTKDGESIRALIIEQTENKIKIKKLKDNSSISIDKLFIDEIKPLNTSITTIDGDTYEGTLTGIDSSKIVLITNDGNKIEIERKLILHSEFADYYSTLSYPMFGLTSGYPKFLQLVGGYQFRYIGLRLDCGLPLNNKDFWGIKSNFLINILKRKTIECNLDLCFGYIHNPPSNETTSFFWFKHEWRYLGISADINISGVFVELGISNNLDDWGELFPLIQLGYVYRFVY